MGYCRISLEQYKVSWGPFHLQSPPHGQVPSSASNTDSFGEDGKVSDEEEDNGYFKNGGKAVFNESVGSDASHKARLDAGGRDNSQPSVDGYSKWSSRYSRSCKNHVQQANSAVSFLLMNMEHLPTVAEGGSVTPSLYDVVIIATPIAAEDVQQANATGVQSTRFYRAYVRLFVIL